MTLTILDLFSGIGGFSLGLERTNGFRTVAFCEIDAYACRVLRKHWPDVPIYGDVRTLGSASLARDGIQSPDVVCGGFPCQDISLTGSGEGLAGARSGLWFEFLRIIGETKPQFAIIENVAALRNRGLAEILRGLAAIRYDAEWHCIPAAAVGAPHRRDRIWIVAYPCRTGPPPGPLAGLHQSETGTRSWDGEPERLCGACPPGTVADAVRFGPQGAESPVPSAAGRRRPADESLASDVAYTHRPRLEIKLDGEAREREAAFRASSWAVEPDVGRVAYGVPDRAHRIKCLGNSLVPQIPEMIGHAILQSIGKD